MAQIVTEQLTGEHSFRGCGFIIVNGFKTAVCGSRRVNFGIRGNVKYIGERITRVPAEEELKAAFKGTYPNTTLGVLVDPVTGKFLLDENEYEEIFGGLTPWIQTDLQPIYPFHIQPETVLDMEHVRTQVFPKVSYGHRSFIITIK